VGRVQQDFNKSNTVLGGIITSTNRFLQHDNLLSMNRGAYTGGVDLLHHWKNKKYYIDAKVLGSYITGDKAAISSLQRSSARYYQRPFADHLTLDSTRTTLTGSGGSISVGRKSQGLWRYSTGISWFSPGLELNDLGYMQVTDIIRQKNEISYFVNKPVSIFRTYSVSLEEGNHWDFGGNHLLSEVEIEGKFEFLNKWAFELHPGYQTRYLDTRLLRGGEALITPGVLSLYSYFRTDNSKKIYLELSQSWEQSVNHSYHEYELSPVLVLRPLNPLKLVAGVEYETTYNELQYVTSDHDDLYLLGTIRQKNLSMVSRIDYSITPELIIQYYGSPFVSRGLYSDFKYVNHPQASKFEDRFQVFDQQDKTDTGIVMHHSSNDRSYTLSPDPDFNFLQFRSNLVARWEFRPGSILYLVWSMDKTGKADQANTSLWNSLEQMGGVKPSNIFLAKFDYWFSL